MTRPISQQGLHSFLQAVNELDDVQSETSPDLRANQPDDTPPRGFRCEHTVYPGTQGALQLIVQLANTHRIQLHVISRGRNWGLGSSSAPIAGCVLLALKNLQQITDFDDELGTVRVEPGVSFAQLADFLDQQSTQAWQAPSIGGPADASVVANALERGDGIGQLGDRARHVYGMVVVQGNGAIFSTGHVNTCEADCNPAFHDSPVGPSLGGLFLQGNLGIVSSAIIRLAPRATDTLFALTALRDQSDWHYFVDEMQSLIKEGLIEPRAITLWNGVKRMARARPRSAWPESELTTANLNTWAATCFFQSFHQDSIAYKWTHAKYLLGSRVERYSVFNDIGKDGVKIADHSAGYSDNQNVRSLYWGKSKVPDEIIDPDKDQCGSLWICVAVPFTSRATEQSIAICEELFSKTNFDPNLGFQAIDHRALHMFIAINYDRELAGADAEALKLHDRLCDALAAQGFPLVRLGIQSMARAEQLLGDRLPLLAKIKAASDPNNILAPGRYLPD